MAMPAAKKKPYYDNYKTKSSNLTGTQLKRAGGVKAAAKRTVNISSTKRVTTGADKGYTLGPGGNRLTGSVVLPNGKTAVYKGGKRVTNKPVTRGGPSGPSGPTKPKPPVYGKPTQGKPGEYQAGKGMITKPKPQYAWGSAGGGGGGGGGGSFEKPSQTKIGSTDRYPNGSRKPKPNPKSNSTGAFDTLVQNPLNAILSNSLVKGYIGVQNPWAGMAVGKYLDNQNKPKRKRGSGSF